jgi:chromosomal replication initiator protein
MQTFIDKLKRLQGALILDGYETEDSCIKIIEMFIRDEQIEIKKASTVENLIPIIRDEIEKYFGLKPGSIQIRRRKRKIVEARQIAHWLACHYELGTNSFIGKTFGNVDNSTVIYSKRTVNNLLKTDAVYRASFKDIQAIIINKLRNEE